MHKIVLPSIVAASFLVAGCGGGSGSADVDVGPMPENGTFTGVWHSPQYGEMHMIQQGSNVVGEYTKNERQGRIQGSVQGNVLRFEWTEEREMVSGVPQTTRGRGYFRYVVDDAGNHNIVGEWGIDDSEAGGGPWNAYKMEGRDPALSTDSEGGEVEETDPFGDDDGGDDIGGGDDLGGGDDFGGGGDDSGGGDGLEGIEGMDL